MTRPYGQFYVAQEAFNRATHSDALREMQSANGDSLRELGPAEIMQVAPFDHATPLNVIRSIDRADFIYSICIFSALAFVAGAVLAMGAK